MRQDGSICASGRSDALGGTIMTDAEGFLGSTKAGFFNNLPVVWTCAQGNCLGTDARSCIQGGNGPGAVEITCGGATSYEHPSSPIMTPNPPSSEFTIGDIRPGSLGAGGTFTLLPAVQTGDGASQVLCSVMVPFALGDTQGIVLQRAMDIVNSDAGCIAAGISAVVEDPQTVSEVEDNFAHPGHLTLQAPAISGGRLIPGLRLMPGQAPGVCFTAGDLDDTMRGRIRSMKLQFTTEPGGTAGGPMTLTERSILGECSITVLEPVGATANGLAAAVAAAFQAPGIPSPFPGCPTEVNPRDVTAQGDSVRTALASDLVVCINDPTVGVTILPTEICTTNTDCDDGNPCTADTCNAAGLCQSAPVANGLPCDDGNACTFGGSCVAGTCGAPVVCNDGNPCTTDTCDPATGACTSTAVVCDDGNPCTTDACTAATGGCVFTPVPAGTTCNDGDLCTSGDICVQPPGSVTPVCQGTAKCADADPCTADLCDPATGACSNSPIVCDDGNPCTSDVCLDGACQSFPIVEAACDDGNLCTTGGVCVSDPFTGLPTCQSQPVNCDDGNSCTVDSCDPLTGGCSNIPVALADVSGLRFTSGTMMTWSGTSGASSWNTYRGTIPAGMLGTRGRTGPLYDQTCFELGDAHGDGVLVSIDAAIPPLGTAFYYLVAQVAGCGEGPAGSDTNGTVIPNAAPCMGR
jgi:hypothetical protein